jgi:hypothetical protein
MKIILKTDYTYLTKKIKAREKDNHETEQGHRVKKDTLARIIMVICLQTAIQNYFYRLLNAHGIQADYNTYGGNIKNTV